MPLTPLELPQGLHRNGTDLQSSGRWRDGSLVRWRDGSMRPVGGWVERVANGSNAKPVRGAISWKTNAGDRFIALGTYEKLFLMNVSNSVTDITPTGFSSGYQSTTLNTGYGASTYGTGNYGVARTDSTSYNSATTWSLDNWGEYLVSCADKDGKIYQYNLSANTLLSNAPTGNAGIIVTSERYLFALGAGGDPAKVQWSDRENNNTWSPSASNQAGSQILQTNGEIMGGVRTRGQTLILTTTDAHTATFVGNPFVYGFERVGTACGIISKKAIAPVQGGAVWMGDRAFFQFSGGSVQEIKCDVGDYFFDNLNTDQKAKVHAVNNSEFGEVWWFYPSASSTECDSYISWSYRENHWMYGSIDRCAGIDSGIFEYPIFFEPDGSIYEHENGLNYEGATIFCETGPMSIGNGDRLMNVVKMIPDEKTQGDVQATFKSRLYPNATETTHGPFDMASPTSLRFQGRQIRMRVTGNVLSDWRVGVMRLDTRQGGMR